MLKLNDVLPGGRWCPRRKDGTYVRGPYSPLTAKEILALASFRAFCQQSGKEPTERQAGKFRAAHPELCQFRFLEPARAA